MELAKFTECILLRKMTTSPGSFETSLELESPLNLEPG
jgi:hypothetical protein